MARTYTPEQLAAIGTTDRTVLLSAAAGSGKTATLTERLIRMITDPDRPLDVSRMLIATFTRAAAGELKERISAALSAAIEKDPANKRLARQALLLPTAKIRTIDAFCHDLVRGHTDALGISPLYRIPDEAEVELLARETMDDLIEDVYRGDYAKKGLDIFSLSESLVSPRMERSLGPKLWEFYRSSLAGRVKGVQTLLATAEGMADCADKPFFDTPIGGVFRASLKEELSARLALVREMTERARATETEKMTAALIESTLSLSEDFTALLAALETSYATFHTALSQPLEKAKTTPDRDLSEVGRMCKAFRAECAKFRKGLAEELAPWSEEALARLYAETHVIALSLALLLTEFERRFLAAKREKGLCEHSDLTLYAYRLLLDEKGEKTPLAHQLTASFDVVCVDEYQDVNELQHKIFEAVSSPTNRFMVGDIKQSIYGFRGAEPSIFASLRASFPTLEENDDRAVLYLTRNFRSAAKILDLANGVFDFLFGTIGESIGYTEKDRLRLPEPKEGDAPLPDTPTPTLFLLPSKDGNDEGGTDELSFVTKQVKALLSTGRKRDGSRVRPADIAILTRSNASKHRMLMALEGAGLPTFYEEEEDFFAYSEILLALCLCHTVNNPRRDIYLAGLLRSPLYRFTMEDLVRIRRHGGATLYDDLVRTAEEEDFPKGRAFLAELAVFRRRAEGERADRLLRYLFDKTAIFAALDEEAQNRLHRFYDLARRREALSFHGLYAFLSYVDEMIAAGKSAGGKTAKGSADEGVYVNTVHRAKGLEFPICILTGCGARLSGGGGDRLPVHYFPSLGFASPVSTHEGMGLVSSPLYRILDAYDKNKNLEEEVRVLYVALTRPKEQLMMTAAPTKKMENFLSDAALLRAFPSRFMLASRRNYAAWITAAVGENDPRLVVKNLSDDPAATIEETTAAKETPTALPTQTDGAANGCPPPTEEEIEAAKAMFRDRFSFVYPHAAEVSLPGKLSVSRLYPGYLDEVAGLPTPTEQEAAMGDDGRADEDARREKAPAVPFYLSGVEEHAAAKAGTATHLFLQFCDFSRILTTEGCVLEKIEAELSRLTSLGFLDPADSARVRRQELAAFATSSLAQEIREARQLHRELRFNAYLPASLFTKEQKEAYDGLDVFVQGVIDLLIERADGSLLLVDYKTDRLGRDALASDDEARTLLFKRHGDQLSYYAEAAERMFGKKPTVAIYSLHAAKLFAWER